MTEPSTEIKLANYQRLLADVNELFDLWWLNDELTERLFNERNFAPSGAESKFGFSDFTRWHRSWYEDAKLFFASQYLLTYRDALCEIEAIVDEEMPRSYYEDQLKEDLWAFVSTESGKAWLPTKQSDAAETRTHRWQASAKRIFKQHRLGKDDDVKAFLLLLHRVAIINDVLHGRGKWHGLTYSKPKSDVTKNIDPVTAFCDHVKAIVQAFAQKNGTVIKTNAKGVAGQYTFEVNADKFCLMMNELRTNYDYYLNDYLQGRDAEGVKQLSLVCPFIGYALSLNIINTPQLQKTDLEPVLLQFYPGKKSIITKLSARSGMPEEQKLFRMVETLLEQYRKK